MGAIRDVLEVRRGPKGVARGHDGGDLALAVRKSTEEEAGARGEGGGGGVCEGLRGAVAEGEGKKVAVDSLGERALSAEGLDDARGGGKKGGSWGQEGGGGGKLKGDGWVGERTTSLRTCDDFGRNQGAPHPSLVNLEFHSKTYE